MAYRNPRWMYHHALATAGSANVTHSGAVASGSSKHYLLDYRPSSLFQWSVSQTNGWIVVDRGASVPYAIDRMIIPDGHNLNDADFRIQRSATGAWGGEEVTLLDSTFGTGVQSFSFTSTSERYIRLYFDTAGQWELGQLWYSLTKQMGRGPEPGWFDAPVGVSIVRDLPTRSVNSLLAAPRRVVAMTHRRVTGTDLAIMTELFSTIGVNALPFYYDPPDDALDPRLMMFSSAEVDREQDHPSPKAFGERWKIEFEMIEQIE